MKIIYSAASKLGGVGLANVVNHAVQGIYKAGYLEKAVVYGNRQQEIPSSFVKIIRFQPTKIFSSLSSRYYYSMKRMWFDYRTSTFIKNNNCDIFHGWTHECLNSIREAKKKGTITIVERGYCHPLYSKKILDDEFGRMGIERYPKGKKFLIKYDHWHREETVALEEFDEADYVIVNSSFAEETFLQNGFPKKKLKMIPRGVDIDLFKPADKSKEDVFRVIFVGMLCIRKGIHYLLEAWKQLKLENAELVFVGLVHEEIKGVLEKYSKMENIKIKGFVENPVELYNSASLFVFPSLDEGSAKVTYEAMACGLPVISTPNSGSLVSDGVDGFLIPIRDVDAIIEKTRLLYENREKSKQMGERGRKNIEPYTWQRYEDSLRQLYDSIFN